jgi:nicotinamidase-related amidase
LAAPFAATGMKTVRQLAPESCCGIIVDVQDFFLSLIGGRRQLEIKANTANLVRLLRYFDIPLVVTLEKPVEQKGIIPKEISNHLDDSTARFEKRFFDLTKDKKIVDHLERLNRRQAVVAGCETDVCVLQSCLGLLRLGYDVFLVEELLFSSSASVESALARMRGEGAVLLSYKSLYYELLKAVEGGRHAQDMLARFGPFPDDLPDSAVDDS